MMGEKDERKDKTKRHMKAHFGRVKEWMAHCPNCQSDATKVSVEQCTAVCVRCNKPFHVAYIKAVTEEAGL